MERCGFIKASASVAACLMLGLALLSCSKETNPVDLAIVGSDLRSAVLAGGKTTVAGNIANDGVDHIGGVIVITGSFPGFLEVCGRVWLDYPCVINETDGSTTTTTCSIDDTRLVIAGDQFDIVNQTTCNGHLNLELTPIDVSQSGPSGFLICQISDLDFQEIIFGPKQIRQTVGDAARACVEFFGGHPIGVVLN